MGKWCTLATSDTGPHCFSDVTAFVAPTVLPTLAGDGFGANDEHFSAKKKKKKPKQNKQIQATLSRCCNKSAMVKKQVHSICAHA